MFGSIKDAYETVKEIQALQISTEVNERIADVLSKLIEAREDALASVEKEAALLQEIRQLKAEIDQMKAWDGEKERYELKRYYPGSFAYALKPGMAGNEPPHRLCTYCYENGKKAILQATQRGGLANRVHLCPSCKTEAVLSDDEMS